MQIIELLRSETPLRQGDLLKFGDGAAERPYGCACAAVLTGDCDLAQEKHYGQILLCPIVPISAYLKEDWARRRLGRIKGAALLKIKRELEGMPQLTGEGGVSETALYTISQSEEAISAALSDLCLSAATKENLKRLVRVVLASSGPESVFERLIKALIERDSSNAEKATATIVREFRDEMKSDNTDVVVFPDELSGPFAASVVLLRHPFSVLAREIGIGESSNSNMVRVGRLCQPIKYLVAQKFGFLFSRFGMPRRIEEDRDTAVDLEDLLK